MEEVMAVWRQAEAVCFDVDSTVIQEEGIDELAKFCGKGAEVQAMWVLLNKVYVLTAKYHLYKQREQLPFETKFHS